MSELFDSHAFRIVVGLALVAAALGARIAIPWAINRRGHRRFGSALQRLDLTRLERARIEKDGVGALLRFSFREQRGVLDHVPPRSRLDALASWTLSEGHFGGLYAWRPERMGSTVRVRYRLVPPPGLDLINERGPEDADVWSPEARRALTKARRDGLPELGMATSNDGLFLVTRGRLTDAQLQSLLDLSADLVALHLDGALFARPVPPSDEPRASAPAGV